GLRAHDDRADAHVPCRCRRGARAQGGIVDAWRRLPCRAAGQRERQPRLHEHALQQRPGHQGFPLAGVAPSRLSAKISMSASDVGARANTSTRRRPSVWYGSVVRFSRGASCGAAPTPLAYPIFFNACEYAMSSPSAPRASSTSGSILCVVSVGEWMVSRLPMSRLIWPTHTGLPWYRIGLSHSRRWLRWWMVSRAFCSAKSCARPEK